MAFIWHMEESRRRKRRERRPPKPLDAARMEEMALAYVARFATSAAKLETYLKRKLRERGYADDPNGETGAGVELAERLVARFVDVGYVDDEGYAKARSRSLTRRGYGARRVEATLRHAGIEEDVRADAAPSEYHQRQAALALARKRGFGPFGKSDLNERTDDGFEATRKRQAVREKQLAAMIRAGHTFDMAREVLDAGNSQEAECWADELAAEHSE